MKWVRVLPLLALSALLPSASWAQGSASTGAGMPGGFEILRQVDGVLFAVDTAKGVIAVDEKKTGKRLTLRIDPKLKIKLAADKGSPLADRRELALSDFSAGQTVRVAFRTSDMAVTELKLKKAER